MGNLNNLLSAVFFNSIHSIRSIVDSGNIPCIHGNCTKRCCINGKFPIFYISKCWGNVLNYDEFDEKEMATVEEMRQRNTVVMDYWTNECHVTFDEIPYQYYNELSQQNLPEESLDDILWYAVDEYIKAGCRMIDLELLETTSKLDFAKVRTLLSHGADPKAKIFTLWDVDNKTTCLNKVKEKLNYLKDSVLCDISDYMEHKHRTKVELNDIIDLVRWSAQKNMLDLLNK
jgi:hypothetical protein